MQIKLTEKLFMHKPFMKNIHHRIARFFFLRLSLQGFRIQVYRKYSMIQKSDEYTKFLHFNILSNHSLDIHQPIHIHLHNASKFVWIDQKIFHPLRIFPRRLCKKVFEKVFGRHEPFPQYKTILSLSKQSDGKANPPSKCTH